MRPQIQVHHEAPPQDSTKYDFVRVTDPTALMHELGAAKVENVSLQQTGCAGLCDQEPMLTLTDKAGGSFRYGRLDKNKVGEIVRDHVLRGQPVLEYLIKA